MTIEEKLARLPHEITSLGKTGELIISNAASKNWEYKGYWRFEYQGNDRMPIESLYEDNHTVFLCSFTEGFENALDDMIDRLEKGGIIQ